MSDLTVAQLRPRTDAEYQVAIDDLFAEVDRIQAKMSQDQADIQRLKVETQILKAESDLIKARTQERLEALERMF